MLSSDEHSLSKPSNYRLIYEWAVHLLCQHIYKSSELICTWSEMVAGLDQLQEESRGSMAEFVL